MTWPIYFDHAATTPPVSEAKRFADGNQSWGNPSSNHSLGKSTATHIERTRERIRKFIDAKENVGAVIFTSGATEANNLAIVGMLRNWFNANQHTPHVITQATEHPSVLEPLKHMRDIGTCKLTILPVDPFGQITADDVHRALRTTTALVAVQHVNSETGTIQPLEGIAEICAQHSCALHIDAAQSFGKVPLCERYGWFKDGIGDRLVSVAVSAHKMGGFMGVGALYIPRADWIYPILRGGGQEGGLRAGTPNAPGIVGWCGALTKRDWWVTNNGLDEAQHEMFASLDLQRSVLVNILTYAVPDINFNTSPLHSPYIVNATFPKYMSGIDIVAEYDRRGVIVSRGCACHDPNTPSEGLIARGLSGDEALRTIRFSWVPNTHPSDFERLGAVTCDIVGAVK